MAKSINLKVTKSITKSFSTGSLVKAKVDDEGNIYTGKGKDKIWLSRGVSGEIACIVADGVVAARFVEIKTKTLKCMEVDHQNPTPKTFKPGKRYQVDSGRPCGAVAGYVFDDNGDPWTLYREDVGFSCTLATFEAKYL